jgi:hypothetical protein
MGFYCLFSVLLHHLHKATPALHPHQLILTSYNKALYPLLLPIPQPTQALLVLFAAPPLLSGGEKRGASIISEEHKGAGEADRRAEGKSEGGGGCRAGTIAGCSA